MRVRITLTRTIRQYLDIELPSVESVEEAGDQIAATLAHDAGRARLLTGQQWFSGDLVEDITVAEIVTLDT